MENSLLMDGQEALSKEEMQAVLDSVHTLTYPHGTLRSKYYYYPQTVT